LDAQTQEFRTGDDGRSVADLPAVHTLSVQAAN